MHHILPLFIGGTDVGVSADSSLLGICQATRRSPKAIREAGGGITPPLFIGEVSKGRRGSKIINNNFSTFIPFIFLYKYSQCVHPISSQAKNLDSEASRLPRSSKKPYSPKIQNIRYFQNIHIKTPLSTSPFSTKLTKNQYFQS